MKKYIIGVIIGIVLSSSVVFAATLIDSKDVTYTPSDNEFNVSNVESALDELYEKYANYINPENNDLFNSDYTIVGVNSTGNIIAAKQGVCIQRNGKINCFKINNYNNEKEHIQQVFSDVECTIGPYNNKPSYEITECIANDYKCSVINMGHVNCYDVSNNSNCGVDNEGKYHCN